MWSVLLAASVVAFAQAGALRIHDIQGPSHRSPWVDQEVSGVSGVVTQIAPHGFYLQDPQPDDDDATSEAIRVEAEAGVVVRIGDDVEVSGTVRETRPGCAGCGPTSDAYANLTTTEIIAARVVVNGTVELPEPVRIGDRPGERAPPSEVIADAVGDIEAGGSTFDPLHHGLDFYESIEGMVVEVAGARVVGPTAHPRGRPREIVVVPSGARFGPPTSGGGVHRAPGDDNPERITVVHDGLPDVDAGDAFTEPIVGVLDYDFGRFELVAARAPRGLRPFDRVAARPLPPSPSDTLSIATFNVENLGPTSAASRVDGIARIIAGDLAAPDVVVLQEIQDESGTADDGVTSASRTYEVLRAAIVSNGGPRYAWRDVPPDDGQDGGEPGGNIRVGFLLREDRGVGVVDRSSGVRRAVRALPGPEGAALLDPSPGRVDPTNDAFVRSRKPVAIELGFRGLTLFVVGVHFDSQIGDQPSFGRFQPPERSTRRQRVEQARVVGDFVRALRSIDPRSRVVVLGDMNDVDGSPPLAALADAGLRDLNEDLEAGDRYTHVFEGSSEALDHILVTDELGLGPVETRIAHVDADFALGASDHDPVLARFVLRSDGSEGLPASGSCACATWQTNRSSHAGPSSAWALLALACLGRLLSQRCFSGKNLAS